MQLPRVSICLLTYRRANVLPRTLDSLLAQTHADFELIINDDCSPDDTEAICRKYASRDPRVRYCKNPRNLRYAGNQSAALQRARTDYVAIVHDGDVYRPDLLEKWTAALVAQPSAALVFNNAGRLSSDGALEVIFPPREYGPLVPGRQLLDEMLMSPGSPIFGIVMVRRSWVLESGPFDPRLPVLADLDMWMRLLARHDAAYIPEPLYAIAPREPGHHNSFSNWDVRREHELLHALNYRRRFSEGVDWDYAKKMRGAVERMFWAIRARHLAECVRHLELGALLRGIAYCIERRRPIDSAGLPDRMLEWDEFERSLSSEPSVGPASGAG